MWKLIYTAEFVFLALGVSIPLASVNEFWIFNSEFSVLSVSYTLFINQHYIVSFLIILFAVLIPFTKILFRILNLKTLDKLSLHKFAMADIFLISFLIFAGKASMFFDVIILEGFYFLLISIVLGYSRVIMARG